MRVIKVEAGPNGGGQVVVGFTPRDVKLIMTNSEFEQDQLRQSRFKDDLMNKLSSALKVLDDSSKDQ